MDMNFKIIAADIERKYPEFYEKNKTILNIIENYPELTIYSKEIFRRMMLFLEELDDLEISCLSRYQRWKIKREKKKHPLADKSFDEYVDLLWGFTRGFQDAKNKQVEDFFARMKEGLKKHHAYALVNREINYLELYISGEIVKNRSLFNLPSFHRLSNDQFLEIQKIARDLLESEFGSYYSELTLDMYKKGVRLFHVQLKINEINALKKSAPNKENITMRISKLEKYQSEYEQLKTDFEGY